MRRIWSLSARRAWIEIARSPQLSSATLVALRKESVDRNFGKNKNTAESQVALRKESVDRNLIGLHLFNSGFLVALRKESVDRNKYVVQCRKVMGGRSPQGERG